MTDPERLLRADATEFERELLEAVRDERPSPELTRRMEAALGILPSAPLSTDASSGKAPAPHAGAASGAGSKVAASVTAKAGHSLWLALGAVGLAGAGLVTALALQPRLTTGNARGLAEERAARQSEAAGQSGPVSPQLSAREVAPPARDDLGAPPSSSVASEREAASLREEIELIDAARAAAARGDDDAARSILARYRQRFPEGRLKREAELSEQRLGAGARGQRTSGHGQESTRRP